MDVLELNIPKDVSATMHLPDPYLVSYYEQAENRTLWLDSELADDGSEIVKKILRWNLEDEDKDIPVEKRKPLRIMLLSPGVDTYVMLAIIDAIRISTTPVYTCVVSLAASAACAILVAGHKRFAFPMSHGMWHSGSAGVSGSMEQVQSATKHLDMIEKHMQEFLLERTKVDQKMLKKYKDKDWYLTASEMLDLGFVDRIVENVNEIL